MCCWYLRRMSTEDQTGHGEADPRFERPPAPAELFDLSGRVALVTGASSGLGRRFAQVLHGAGAHVVICARRAERLEELADLLGDRVTVLPADLARSEDRESLVERTLDEVGRASCRERVYGLV